MKTNRHRSVVLAICASALPAVAIAASQTVNSYNLTTLVNFNGTNGNQPQAPLTIDAAGNLFGTTDTGGSAGDGEVFELFAGQHALRVLGTFTGTNGQTPLGGVTFAPNGLLYGTTRDGGTFKNGLLFSVSTGAVPVLSTVHNFTTTSESNGSNADGANPVSGLTADSSGNLFGTTRLGGPNGQGAVYELPVGATTTTTITSFSGGFLISGVAVDSAGSLYGTTTLFGGTVYKVPKGSKTATTLANFMDSDVSGLYGTVVLDNFGNLYGAAENGDSNNSYAGLIYKINLATGVETTAAEFNGADGQYPQSALTVDAAGDLFGTTYAGGANNDGVVFELPAGSNTPIDLYSFSGTDGAEPLSSVTADANGDLFGTTYTGGLYGDGTVYELTPVPEPTCLLIPLILAGSLSRRRRVN